MSRAIIHYEELERPIRKYIKTLRISSDILPGAGTQHEFI